MRQAESPSTSLSNESQALLRRFFEHDKTALKDWNSYKNTHFTQSIDIYLHFINAQEKSNDYPVSLNARSVTVQSSTEMRMACAFVLASNHKWTLQYNKGELCLTAGSLKNVDLSMLAAIQHWHNMPGDALTYEFFLRGQHLPEKFVDYILRPYLKILCTSERTNSATVRTPQASQSSMTDSNESSISSRHESSESNEPIANTTTQNANILHPADTSTRDIDERIDEAFTHLNIHATSTASIEKSITPRRLMAVKNELLRKNVESTNTFSANTEDLNIASLATEPQESNHTLPSVAQQEAIPPLQQINIENFLDDEYLKYLFKKALKPSGKYWIHRALLHLDATFQRILRNKRIGLLNIMDLTLGSLANIILMLTTPLWGSSLLIAISIYIVATVCTLTFWFITESIVLYCMKRWHQNKLENLHNTIAEIETNINTYPIDATRCSKGNTVLTQESIEINSLQIELKQHKQKLLKSLMFLSAHDGMTDALITERRAFDRIAKKAISQKDVAHHSFNAADRYATSLSELECQKKHLESALDPITESLIVALELYSQDKLSIEENINTLLGSDNEELNIFDSINAEDLSQLFYEASQREERSGPFSICQRIWHTIYKPPIDEQIIEDIGHESKHKKETLLGLLFERANEISPEKYTVIGNELRNPNTRLADLFSKAKEGIQTSQEASEQPNKLGIVTATQVIQTVSRTLFNYSIFYFWRIPFRIHESAIACALIKGIKPKLSNLLNSAFPNPIALGGVGIIFWCWFKLMSYKFDKWNNQINQVLCTLRENHMKNYHDPYNKDTIPSWMELQPSNTLDSDGKAIVRTREQMGHFNAGVLDDGPVQGLSEHEWRAIRREAKHASDELPPLMNKLEKVQLKLSSLTEQLRKENPGKKITIEKASIQQIARLLIRYNLLAHRIQQMTKTAQQANYECVRHVHKVNQRVKIQSRPQQ